MALNLGFQTKYILNPWCMLFHPVKVPFKVISILFIVHSARCVPDSPKFYTTKSKVLLSNIRNLGICLWSYKIAWLLLKCKYMYSIHLLFLLTFFLSACWQSLNSFVAFTKFRFISGLMMCKWIKSLTQWVYFPILLQFVSWIGITWRKWSG